MSSSNDLIDDLVAEYNDVDRNDTAGSTPQRDLPLHPYRTKTLPAHTTKVSNSVKKNLFVKHCYLLSDALQNRYEGRVILNIPNEDWGLHGNATFSYISKKRWYWFNTQNNILIIDINKAMNNNIELFLFDKNVAELVINRFDQYRQELNCQDSYRYDVSIEIIKNY